VRKRSSEKRMRLTWRGEAGLSDEANTAAVGLSEGVTVYQMMKKGVYFPYTPSTIEQRLSLANRARLPVLGRKELTSV